MCISTNCSKLSGYKSTEEKFWVQEFWFFKSQQSVWQLCKGHVKTAWRRHQFVDTGAKKLSARMRPIYYKSTYPSSLCDCRKLKSIYSCRWLYEVTPWSTWNPGVRRESLDQRDTSCLLPSALLSSEHFQVSKTAVQAEKPPRNSFIHINPESRSIMPGSL